MRLAAVLFASLLAGAAGGQSVNPPIAVFEGGATRARGSLVIDNPTLFPISFVIEPKRFLIACSGDFAFGAIDTTHMQVRLSAMSGRLAAKQRATVFYDVTVDSVPAWLAFVVALSPGRPEPGLNVRLEIPHMVYLMQRERVSAADVAIDSAAYDIETRMLRIRVANRSTRLTRISELVAVSSAGREYSIDACPLFPNSAREFEYAWPDANPPARVIARFTGFAVDRAVTANTAAPRAPGPSCAPCPLF